MWIFIPKKLYKTKRSNVENVRIFSSRDLLARAFLLAKESKGDLWVHFVSEANSNLKWDISLAWHKKLRQWKKLLILKKVSWKCRNVKNGPLSSQKTKFIKKWDNNPTVNWEFENKLPSADKISERSSLYICKNKNLILRKKRTHINLLPRLTHLAKRPVLTSRPSGK